MMDFKNFQYYDFIELIVSLYKPKNYLELGVETGRGFLVIEQLVEKAVAVDINKMFDPRKGIFFIGTTEKFFKQNKEKFDLIFIDAYHHIDSVRFDLQHALKILNDGGVLLLHDTDPESEEMATQQFCWNAHKIVDEIDTDKYFTFTFPTDNSGLTLVTLKSNRRVNGFNKS